MQTSLLGIANKAREDRNHRFKNLFALINAESLQLCWRFINKKAAAGVDQESAKKYALNLESNVKALADSVKNGWYRAKLVLRKYIPKAGGKLRPLGIPAIADKLLQRAVAKIFEAIYEQDFLQDSYGYRPKVGAHKAIKAISGKLALGRFKHVVEADIKGFFDNIDHDKLLEMLKMRIDDRPLLNLIKKWLRAGVLDTNGLVLHPSTGTPQGGIISPLLANIYLHYTLDMWFDNDVRKHCAGEVYLCRYADDFICLFERKQDAEKFYRVLPKRLAKFGLEVAADKTNIIQFDRKSKLSFDFLSFEFRWGSNRYGKTILKRRTSRKKFRSALVNLKEWCKSNCHLPINLLIAKLNRKLRGYWNYYGIRGNYESLSDYLYHVEIILFKWLNRRSQRRSYNWEGFRNLLKDFPILKPRICHEF